MKPNSVPQLRSTSKQPLSLDALNFSHLHVQKLGIRFWLGVSEHHAVDMFLNTFWFMRCIVHENFLSKRNEGTRHSQAVAILLHTEILPVTRTARTISLNPERSVDQNMNYKNNKVGHDVV